MRIRAGLTLFVLAAMAVTPPDAQGRIRLAITDYHKPGDKLTIDLNAAADRIPGLRISTFIDSAKNAVGMTVTFGALAGGTVNASMVDLEVAAQQLAVKVENSGYRKLGSRAGEPRAERFAHKSRRRVGLGYRVLV